MPLYLEQGSFDSIQPTPLVKHPIPYSAQSVFVVNVSEAFEQIVEEHYEFESGSHPYKKLLQSESIYIRA